MLKSSRVLLPRFHSSLFGECCSAGLLLSLLILPVSIKGKLIVSDNFDSYNNPGDDQAGGWTHYDPVSAPPFSSPTSWTFPAEGAGKAYRLKGLAPFDGTAGPVRLGSYRNNPGETYTDFFTAFDIVNFDENLPLNTAAVVARVTSPGVPASQEAYFAGYVAPYRA